MMRRVVLASCLVFGFVATNSLAWSPTTPEIAVAKHGGASNAIKVDSSGNIYTAGFFQGTADFDPGAGTTNLEAMASDVFVLKLNTRGELTWAKQFGDWGDSEAHSVAVDSLGNVYTAGFFAQTTDFDPGAGTFTLTSLGSQDVFVSKLNSAGEFVWAKRFGNTGADRAYSMAVDSSGNVYTVGFFEGTVDFDPGAGTANLTSAGSSDVFVSKLDSNGAFVWGKRFGGAGGEDGRSVSVDSSGNVYSTGYFSGTVDFDPGEGTFELTTPSAFQRAFVSKLDSNGAFVWAKKFAGTVAFATSEARSVAVDSSGNVYTTGYFESTEDFDPGAGTANLTSAGSFDVFVSKLDSEGAFVWAKRLGGVGDERAQRVAVDSSGNVYTGGKFSGTVDFDPGTGTANLTSAVDNYFLSKLDSSGAYVWAKTFRSADQMGDPLSVVVDSSGYVYTAAAFSGTVDVDPNEGTVNLSDGGSFVSKLSSVGAAVSATAPATSTTTTTTTTTTTITTTPAQAEEARRLAESRNAFELSERCRKANHAFNDCPLWPGNVTTSTTSTSSTSSTSSTTSTTTPATSSTTSTTTPATSSTTSTTTPSPKVLTKQSLSLKVSFAQLSRRLSKPAQTNLQLLVNRLNQASNISITCSGTMTLSEIQNSKSLARNRATTVCAKLRSLGLKATFNTTSNPISKLTKKRGRFVVVAATYSSD